jgi:hypothetical protein
VRGGGTKDINLVIITKNSSEFGEDFVRIIIIDSSISGCYKNISL